MASGPQGLHPWLLTAAPPGLRTVPRAVPPIFTEVIMELSGKRAAVLVEQQYQEMEVWYPIYRLREAGCKVTVVGPEAGQSYPSKLGYPCKSDRAARDVSADDFDLLVIPGGFAPDYLRRHEAVLRLVGDMAE